MKSIKKLLQLMEMAAPYKNRLSQLKDIILHKVIVNFSAADYYHFEFYKANKTWKEKGRYVAFGGSRYWPFENNEFKFTTALSNKYIQKILLLGFGLPTPPLIAIIGKEHEINNKERVRGMVDSLGQDFVIKPVSGAGGSGVLVLSKQGEGFRSGVDSYTWHALWALLGQRFEQGYLVEERVRNIGALAELNPESLNTYRVVTIKTNDGRWHIAATSVKIGKPGAVVDNNAGGGVQINLDQHGKAYQAYDFEAEQSITHCPRTGVSLLDLELDGFAEVNNLALQASKRFGFLGTIGWDIAYTAQGPMVIEGNIVWGCSSLQRGRPGIITDEIAKGLSRRSMFTIWDKNRLYPNYHRKSFWRRIANKD